MLAPGSVTFPESDPVSISGAAAGIGLAAGGELAGGGTTGAGVDVDDGAGGGVYAGRVYGDVVVVVEVLELGDGCTVGVIGSGEEEGIASKIGAVEDPEVDDWDGKILLSVDVVYAVVNRGRVVGPETSPAGTKIVTNSSTVTMTSSITVTY